MSPADQVDLSNETLVAYIDGELGESERELVAEALIYDEEARDRLSVLKAGGRPFSEAFDLLNDAAPDDRLQGMLADLLARKQAGRAGPGDPKPSTAEEKVIPFRSRRIGGSTPIWQMAAAAAILVFVFTGGLVTGGYFTGPAGVDQPVGWREAAARYVALYSAETVEGYPNDPAERQANLQRIETALGLPLGQERVEINELTFEGSQLLKLKDKPLAQIAYLHGGSTPVALCIIRSGKPEAGPATETRQGLNVVHWIADGYGYMVIGDVPDDELRRISEEFRARFS